MYGMYGLLIYLFISIGISIQGIIELFLIEKRKNKSCETIQQIKQCNKKFVDKQLVLLKVNKKNFLSKLSYQVNNSQETIDVEYEVVLDKANKLFDLMYASYLKEVEVLEELNNEDNNSKKETSNKIKIQKNIINILLELMTLSPKNISEIEYISWVYNNGLFRSKNEVEYQKYSYVNKAPGIIKSLYVYENNPGSKPTSRIVAAIISFPIIIVPFMLLFMSGFEYLASTVLYVISFFVVYTISSWLTEVTKNKEEINNCETAQKIFKKKELGYISYVKLFEILHFDLFYKVTKPQSEINNSSDSKKNKRVKKNKTISYLIKN